MTLSQFSLQTRHKDNGIITARSDVLRHRFHYRQMFPGKGNVIPLLADLSNLEVLAHFCLPKSSLHSYTSPAISRVVTLFIRVIKRAWTLQEMRIY